MGNVVASVFGAVWSQYNSASASFILTVLLKPELFYRSAILNCWNNPLMFTMPVNVKYK